MLRNILYISASIAVFFSGLISYGIILNLREITLEEAIKLKGLKKIEDAKLIVNRNSFRVELYSGKIFVKSYKAAFGKNAASVKKSGSDLVTPIGEYRICSIENSGRYHRFMKLNYPNEKDIAEALKRKYITKQEFDTIIKSSIENDCQCEGTRLSANIGIHGIGEYDFIFRNLPFPFNWTDGSIAISNESIDELYSVVKIGTSVKITF